MTRKPLAPAQRGVVDHVIDIEGRQHQDLRAVVCSGQDAGCGDAVQLGHSDIHHDDVRVSAGDDVEHLPAVCRLANNLQVRFASQDHPEPGTDQRLIVGDYHADHEPTS